jgi:ethanolaminephosphotransferase
MKHEKAKSFHEIFSKDVNNKNAYKQALDNYMQSSREISDKLVQQSLEVNLLYVVLGLFMNILISAAILIPTDMFKVKDLKLNWRTFMPLILIGIGLKVFLFNEIFNQSNDVKSFLVVIIVFSLAKIVGDILVLKLERYKLHLFDNDILYLLIIGHIFFTISVASSSFIEEEHQIWYYFCNATFIILTFYEFRGRRSLESFVGVFMQCFPILTMHIVIRRMNQTGDKWINLRDIGDWLHKRENEEWLNISILLSLVCTAIWLFYVHVRSRAILPSIIIAHLILYFHHTRSLITER